MVLGWGGAAAPEPSAAAQAQSSARDFAHAELLHLTRHGQRKLADDLPVARDLEHGDSTAAVPRELLRAERRSRFGLNPGHDLLAILAVWHADHLGVAHARVREQ